VLAAGAVDADKAKAPAKEREEWAGLSPQDQVALVCALTVERRHHMRRAGPVCR